MNIHAGITLALGSFEASYGRGFSDYREAEVKSRITVPKRDRDEDDEQVHKVHDVRDVHDVEEVREAGPFVPDDHEQQETIGEIRVHGNAFVSDAQVLQIAGLSVGQVLPPDGLDAVERRLKASGRFDTVEVRKRYRSLAMTDVAIVLVVHERPGVRSGTTPNGTPRIVRINPFRRFTNSLMFLPILSYADGYGFTYGARFSTVNLLGVRERLSVPLTWGGTRRAAVEFERTFRQGPLTRITSTAAIWQRENPRFEIDDRRLELKGRAERALGDLVRVGFEAGRQAVRFGVLDDKLWTVGGNAELDTRGDPGFPANAVLLSAGWTGLHITPGLTGTTLPRINRYTTDARGYVRVVRQAVIAGRAWYTAADATLPPYERLLLGGSSTLRGFRTGTFDGDRLLATSVELRVPTTSVISGAKLGFIAFLDAGKAWDFDRRLEDAQWHRGAGGGVFLLASMIRLNLNVARALKDGDVRVHLSSGFSF
jgi:outer membrane protein assembly factor BamA